MSAEIENAIRVRDLVQDDYLRFENIHGNKIGKKTRSGIELDEIAIIFFVIKKMPREQVPNSELIPESIQGVPTDVIEEDFMIASNEGWPNYEYDPDNTHYRPLVGGVQISGSEGSCTLGVFITTAERENTTCLLTNGHCYNNGDNVYQPHGNKNEIGTIWYSQNDTEADVAIASVNGDLRVAAEIHQIDSVTEWRELISPVSLVPVKKRGMMSGLTYGQANSNETRTTKYGDKYITRYNQIVVYTPNFQVPGDSGSALLDDKNRVVGLLYGSFDYGSKAVALPIKPIMVKHKADILKKNNYHEVRSSSRARMSTEETWSIALQELNGTPQGRHLISTLQAHYSRIADLIHKSPSLEREWQKIHGNAFISEISFHIANNNIVFPNKIKEIEAQYALDTLLTIAKSKCDPGEVETLERAKDTVSQGLGKSWQSFLDDLTRECV